MVIGAAVLMLIVAAVFAMVSAHQPTVDRADDVAVFSPPLTGRMVDVLRGELRREAGCTYIDAVDGRRWLVLFPDLGTRWDSESLWVATKRYWLGREVHLRGADVKLPASGFEVVIPADCRETGFAFMVQT